MTIAVLGTLLVTSACSAGEPASTDDSDASVRIAFLGSSAANAYSQSVFEAIQKDVAAAGGAVDFLDADFDARRQIAAFEDAITSEKYDGFVVMPIDGPGLVAPTERAIANGMKVAAVNFPIGREINVAEPQVEGTTTSVIEDRSLATVEMAESVNTLCEDRDPCEVGVLWTSRELPFIAVGIEPFKSSLDANVKIVSEIDAGALQAEGEKATTDMLQANPNLSVLVSDADQQSLGAERAITNAGKSLGLADRTDDQVAIVSYGASTEGVKRVRDGKWYQTGVLLPATMGSYALAQVLNAINGDPVESDGLRVGDLTDLGSVFDAETAKANPDFVGEWNG